MDKCEFCMKRNNCSGLKQFMCEAQDYACYELDRDAVEEAKKQLNEMGRLKWKKGTNGLPVKLKEKDGERKIKAKFKQIISRLIDGKMYYEILYIDEKGNSTIGFGSYNVGYVVRWLNECFEL